MAVMMLPLMRMGPSLMGRIAGKVMGGDPADRRNMMGGIVLHLIYGTVMGAIFAVGSTYLVTFVNPLVNGILFAVLLFIIMVVVVFPIARAPMPGMMMTVVFLVLHLVYGAIVGTLTPWLSGVPIY